MTFTPSKSRLLVKVTDEEKTTEGGFIIPSKEKGRLIKATIISSGFDIVNEVLGSTAYFQDTAGIKITLDGVDCLILDLDDVLGFS